MAMGRNGPLLAGPQMTTASDTGPAPAKRFSNQAGKKSSLSLSGRDRQARSGNGAGELRGEEINEKSRVGRKMHFLGTNLLAMDLKWQSAPSASKPAPTSTFSFQQH
jgi:hypothetical protein